MCSVVYFRPVTRTSTARSPPSRRGSRYLRKRQVGNVLYLFFERAFVEKKTYRIRENSEKKIVRVVNQGNRFSRFNYLSRPRSHLGGQRYLAIVRIGGPVLLRRKGSQASMDRIRDLHGEYWISIYPPTSCPFHIRPLVRMRERRENLWQSAVGTRPKE